MLTGMWALVVFRTASQPYIGQYNVTGKFFAFQVGVCSFVKYL